MRHLLTLFLLIESLSLSAQSPASRMANSPYPVSARPDTLCLVSFSGLTVDQQLSIVTLQGVLAVTKPRIMIQAGNANFIADLSARYGVVYDSTYLHNFAGLMAHFAGSINGYLLCIPNDSSANMAISACRSFNAIAATSADTAVLDSLGLPMLYNMLGHSRQWLYDTLQPSLSKRVITYQDPSKGFDLSDYSIFAGALQYWDTVGGPFSDTAYSNMTTGTSVMMGWGPDEHNTVLQASRHGVMVHASDWASNLSTYTNIDVPNLAQKNAVADTTIIPGTHTVCFVMSDGDNVQWLTGDFQASGWYGSPHRGQANIGWTISPALAELAPTMVKYLYDTATATPQGSDQFIASASGLGYFYPDAFTHLDSAAALTSRMMHKAGLRILNIIGNDFNDTFFTPYLNQPDIDAIFYYDYNNYAGMAGRTACVNGKPVISARYNLWSPPLNTPAVVSVLVNGAPKDPTTAAGYSLIDVNVWTNNVDSILSTIARFDSTIRVVSPAAFVKLFKTGTLCESTAGIEQPAASNLQLNAAPNPAAGSVKITYTLPAAATTELALYDLCGHKVLTLSNGPLAEGPHETTANISALANGIYFISLKGSSSSVTRKLVIGN